MWGRQSLCSPTYFALCCPHSLQYASLYLQWWIPSPIELHKKLELIQNLYRRRRTYLRREFITDEKPILNLNSAHEIVFHFWVEKVLRLRNSDASRKQLLRSFQNGPLLVIRNASIMTSISARKFWLTLPYFYYSVSNWGVRDRTFFSSMPNKIYLN